jgi:surface polysaccharide O-acyltransferase-like enzyme
MKLKNLIKKMDKKENKNYDEKNLNENNIIILQNNKFKTDSRLYYFDWLRIISSFSVVLTHVSASFYKQEMDSYKWKIAYYYNGLSRFAVPNFFMISGALFLKADLSIKKIYNKYIKRIFIHLLIWSVIYSFDKIKLSKFDLTKAVNIIIDGNYHLWFLFVTIKLYAIIPFYREIARNEKLFLF